jgi:hypothetical protein
VVHTTRQFVGPLCSTGWAQMFAADYYFCLDNGDRVVVVGTRFTVAIQIA